MADEREISQRYRELPREEPPRHLDDAILAAARRAAETRPAPLVVPTGRRRWYGDCTSVGSRTRSLI